LQAEVAELMAKAEAADQADVPDGMSIPEELARREARLAAIARAKATIEARAKERHARERADYEAKLKAREAKTAATGKKPAGRPPAAPVEGPLPTDQVNLTDEESRIMPVAGGGFEQCYNAQAAVAVGSLLVIAANVVQAPNDKQQLEPMLGKLAVLPDELGNVEALLADNGYFSESNVNACASAGIDPVIAMGREAIIPRSMSVSRGRRRRRRRTPRRLRRWTIISKRPRARNSTPCASRRPSRYSASSNRCSGSANSCCVGSTMCAVSGTS
jgi:hypothetical protein